MIHEQHAPVAFEHPRDSRSALRASAGQVRFVDLPAQRMFCVEGTGAPGDQAFRDAMAALYPVAYTLHFAQKRRGIAEPVGTLEGTYWSDDSTPLLDVPDDGRDSAAGIHWRLMLPVPPSARPAEIDSAIWEVAARKAPAALELLHVETLAEGRSAQTLHVGAYDAERPTLERLRAAISDAGFVPAGRHHEIYVSDPNRTAPERLRTVIRYPIQPAAVA